MYYNKFMIELNIPGKEKIQLAHLVCDVNGTLAVNGILVEGVEILLKKLSHKIEIHLITANTHGQQEVIDQQLGLKAVILSRGDEAVQKAKYVEQLGQQQVIAIGQGANDALMLKMAKIGIGVISQEGLAVEALLSADIIMPDIISALNLLEHPSFMVATLRK